MAQRVRHNLNRRIGILENWSTAFIRIDPSLHDSTTPSFRVFIRSLDARARTFGTIVWYVLARVSHQSSQIYDHTIDLLCSCRRMPRIRQAYCTVVESQKSMLRISLATLPPCPHGSRATKRLQNFTPDLRSLPLRLGYSRLRRKRSLTIVYCRLFVSQNSVSKVRW